MYHNIHDNIIPTKYILLPPFQLSRPMTHFKRSTCRQRSRYQCKRYLSHFIQKRDEKNRKQDVNTKAMRYALRP